MINQEDRNVLNTLLMVIGALTAFFIFSIVAARMVSASAEKPAVDPMVESATIDRIKPFGEVNIGTAPVAAATTGAEKGLTAHLAQHVTHLVQQVHLSLVIKVLGKHVLHKETAL